MIEGIFPSAITRQAGSISDWREMSDSHIGAPLPFAAAKYRAAAATANRKNYRDSHLRRIRKAAFGVRKLLETPCLLAELRSAYDSDEIRPWQANGNTARQCSNCPPHQPERRIRLSLVLPRRPC